MTLTRTGEAPLRLTAQRLYDEPSLHGVAAGGVAPSPDGRSVAYSLPARDDPRTGVLWMMDAASGQARPLLDMRTLSSDRDGLSEDAFRLQQRSHAPPSTTAIRFGWRSDSGALWVFHAGDLHLVSAADGTATALTKDAGIEADPQLAPGGAHLAFVRDRNLFVRSLETGEEAAVGADAGPGVGYGIVEFVVQEELRRFTGAWWSPDGRRLAYVRLDERAIPPIPRIGIDTTRLNIVEDIYPLTGETNASSRLFVRDVATGTTVEMEADFGGQVYLADLQWSADSRTLLVQRLSRSQQHLEVLSVDALSGACRVLLTETSDTWIDIEQDMRTLAGGEFLLGSTRSGWRHLYLYDGDGRLIRPVTQGEWRVSSSGLVSAPAGQGVVSIDEAKGLVYFTASIETPIERALYRQSYRDPGEPERVTRASGWWSAAMAPGAPVFVGTRSDVRTPVNVALYGLDGAHIAWISENRLDETHPLHPYLPLRPEYAFGRLAGGGGEELHYQIVKPADFDPSRRYPTIVRVYGGPGPQLVRNAWPPAGDLYWTQRGYVLFTLDNRGSANRSRAFEHVFQLDLGGPSAEDQMRGLDFLRTLPFVNPDRIGMTGWSFGGYMTMRLMCEPDSGLVAGAVGGVPAAFGFYDTCYTERYLGTPQDHPEAYARSDLLPRLAKLSGELLVAQGMSDDNVLLINYVALLLELQKHGKLFETMVYPGQGHAIGGKVAPPHLLRTFTRFFARHLGGDGD